MEQVTENNDHELVRDGVNFFKNLMTIVNEHKSTSVPNVYTSNTNTKYIFSKKLDFSLIIKFIKENVNVNDYKDDEIIIILKDIGILKSPDTNLDTNNKEEIYQKLLNNCKTIMNEVMIDIKNYNLYIPFQIDLELIENKIKIYIENNNPNEIEILVNIGLLTTI